MPYLTGDNNCCGLREIAGLSEKGSPEEKMKNLALIIYGPAVCGKIEWKTSVWGDDYWTDSAGYNHYRNEDERDDLWRYAVFTQAGSRATYGKQFAAYIRKHKLGLVTQATTKTVRNPNTGNILKAWLWTIDHPAMKRWIKAVNKVEKKREAKK